MVSKLLQKIWHHPTADEDLPEVRLSDDAEKIATTMQIADTLKRLMYLEREVELAERRRSTR